MHPLAIDGTVVVGRAPDCQLVVRDSSVSRHHARIETTAGRAVVIDLGSQNGTLVNNHRVARHELVRGDVIAIGTVILVFHGPSAAAPAISLVTAVELRASLARELERVVHYGRELAVVHVTAERGERAELEAALAPELRRLDLIAWSGPREVELLLPEAGREHVEALIERTLAALPGARLGYALSPVDGCDGDALLGGARAAAAATAPGTAAGIATTMRVLALGDREVVIADPAMARVYALVERLAAAELPVLVTGETGTGKELIAAALHHLSPRRARPRVAINCAALPDTLVESELFGHERGAFSGAATAKPGIFEQAHGGTVFLDEIGELSLHVQAKLLRALETRRVVRLGDVRELEVDFRLISATNRDLKAQVAQGLFRQDLYYRLGGATVWLPPLRDRPREIPILAHRFVAEAAAQARRAPLALTTDALQRLATHPWPGNVRELKHVCDYLVATTTGAVIQEWEVEDVLAASGEPTPPPVAPPPRAEAAAFRPLAEEVEDLERTRIGEALRATGGNQTRAARLIAMPLRTFLTKLKRYDLA
ncbi:MAG: sigma 54-interacting transcriptional regulator [Deltaproteobacteria bacterium]|nr:sigma 54-interacting transcriptional regulator [Deltaproteobacteria bacterium]